jgi:pimeloyl-ACP methyl ester carboxylesterase
MSSGDRVYPIWTAGMSRREALRLSLMASAGLAAVALLGCGSDDEKKETMTPTSAPTAVPPSGFFDSDGLKIHYETFGEGAPIVVVHGFMGSIQSDWIDTGLVDTLKPVRRVIALDNRGHGQSDKPHEPEDYQVAKMGQDVLNLMDYLGIEKADIFGYSMGAFISSWVLIHHEDRLSSVLLGGTGSNLKPNDPKMANDFAAALRAEDPSTITDPLMQSARQAVDAMPGIDREAIAACVVQFLPLSEHFAAADFANVAIPVKIINGAEDSVTAGVGDLVAAIPGAEYVEIPGKDHLSVRVDPLFHQEVLSFLNEQ